MGAVSALQQLLRKPGFSADKFKQLWEEQRTLKEMAELFGTSQTMIFKTARVLKLKSRAQLAEEASMEWTPEDPTLDEIIERAAAIRDSWPEAEKLRRMGATNRRVELSNYIYHARTSSFSSTG